MNYLVGFRDDQQNVLVVFQTSDVTPGQPLLVSQKVCDYSNFAATKMANTWVVPGEQSGTFEIDDPDCGALLVQVFPVTPAPKEILAGGGPGRSSKPVHASLLSPIRL